jgi:hypothetical protein
MKQLELGGESRQRKGTAVRITINLHCGTYRKSKWLSREFGAAYGERKKQKGFNAERAEGRRVRGAVQMHPGLKQELPHAGPPVT